MQVLVAGMHRSGTSMVTQLLNSAGCYVGAEEDLMLGMPDNPRGYWERKDICTLNTSALNAAGVDWNTTIGSEIETLGPAERREIVHGFRDLIHTLDEHQPWVVKDPRLSILLPLWRPLLSDFVVVYCHRHPLEVARSLQGRDGIPINIGVALWEVYNLAGLANTRKMKRILVSHEAMLEDPVKVGQTLFDEIAAFGGSEIDMPDSKEVLNLIEPKLHRSTVAEELAQEYLGATQTDLLEALNSGRDLDRWSLDDLTQASRDLIIFYRETEIFRGQAIATQEQVNQVKRSVSDAEAWLREHVGPIEEMLRDGAAGRGDLLTELQQVHEDKAAVGRLLESVSATKDDLAEQLQRIHSEKADLGVRLDSAHEAAVGLKSELTALEAAKEKLEIELRASRTEQASLAGRLEETHHDLERMGGLLEKANLDRDAVAQQLQQTHSEKAEIGVKLDQALQQMTSAHEAAVGLKSELTALEAAKEKLEIELRASRTEQASLAERLEQTHHDLERMGGLLEKANLDRDAVAQQLQQTHSEKAEIGVKLDQAHQQMTSDHDRLESMREEKNDLAGRLEQAHADMTHLGKHLEKNAEQTRSLAEQLQEVHAAKAELGIRFDEVNLARQQLADELDSLTRIHREARAARDEAMADRDELHAMGQDLEKRLQAAIAEADVLKAWKRAFERRGSVRLYRSIQGMLGIKYEGPPVDLADESGQETGDDPS